MGIQERVQKIKDNSFYRFTYDPTMLVSKTVRRIMSVLKLAHKAVITKSLPEIQKNKVLAVMGVLIAEYEVIKEKSESRYTHLKKQANK